MRPWHWVLVPMLALLPVLLVIAWLDRRLARRQRRRKTFGHTMSAHITIDEMADELGRTPHWMRAQWRLLVKMHALPPPVLHTDGGPLRWNRAQFYAWLDRPLTPQQRVTAAAYRAAALAGRQGGAAQTVAALVEDARARLDRELG